MKHEWMTNNPPEEICKYLVTDDCGCLQIATWTNEFYLGHKVIGHWHWERQQYTNVVAWMPLPHPYISSNEDEQESRNKAIDEFAERLKNHLNEFDFWKYGITDGKNYQSRNYDYMIDKIAEELKGGAT